MPSWPHILSISRILMAVPIATLVVLDRPDGLLVAAGLFALTSMTDLLDGPLARRGRTVGPLGIYLDTTGDKVLVSVVLIALADRHIVDAWMAMAIVGREFLVSGVRTLAAVQGYVISANLAGKLKTTVTLASMVIVLVGAADAPGGLMAKSGYVALIRGAGWYGMVLATALTVISGALYIRSARPLFLPDRRAPAEVRRRGMSSQDVRSSR